jgi:hypothetical protein
MHDVSDAEKVYAGLVRHIGYVKQIAPDVWLPIDLDKETIGSPSGKDDAVNVVHLNDKEPLQAKG